MAPTVIAMLLDNRDNEADECVPFLNFIRSGYCFVNQFDIFDRSLLLGEL